MQMTLQELNPKMFLKQNAIAEDFHVRLSALLDTDEVSKILEELYFLKSCGLLKSDTLAIYSLKTSKDYSTMRGGATFETIIGTMAELGYCVEWQVLNSKDFGVPQNRERVFIVGHFGRPSGRKVFPIIGDGKEIIELQRHKSEIVTNTLDTRIEGNTRGTYPILGGGVLKVNGYHKE